MCRKKNLHKNKELVLMAEEKKEQSQTEKTEKTEEKKAENVETAENKEKKADTASPSEEEKKEKELTPEEKIAALEKENAELKDQLLRRAADFDNYRKRMLKEKQETYDYANASLLEDLLESLDNFDRTIAVAKDAKDAKTIADGIKMINESLVKMLEDKYGLKAYGKEGEDFDPNEHEAIGRVEDEDAKKETLKQIYLKGYKLKDRVIRHAKVMVNVPKA